MKISHQTDQLKFFKHENSKNFNFPKYPHTTFRNITQHAKRRPKYLDRSTMSRSSLQRVEFVSDQWAGTVSTYTTYNILSGPRSIKFLWSEQDLGRRTVGVSSKDATDGEWRTSFKYRSLIGKLELLVVHHKSVVLFLLNWKIYVGERYSFHTIEIKR